jgi:hypothetical protein
MPDASDFSTPTDPDCHSSRIVRTENYAMCSILWGLAIMTALASGNAVAVDPTDEDRQGPHPARRFHLRDAQT